MIIAAHDGTLSTSVTARLEGAFPALEQLLVLRYAPAVDPYAVVLAFEEATVVDFETGEHDEDSAVDWLLSRDTLAAGHEPDAPTGDVRVDRAAADPQVRVVLRPGTPVEATVTLPREQVEDFLAATFRAVPAGAEYVDWDGLIRRIIAHS